MGRLAGGDSLRDAALASVVRPWTVILLVTGAFQVYRGAPVDGAMFLVVGCALLVDTEHVRSPFLKVLDLIRLPMTMACAAATMGAAAVVAAAALTPRYGIADGVVVGLTVSSFSPWPGLKLVARPARICGPSHYDRPRSPGQSSVCWPRCGN